MTAHACYWCSQPVTWVIPPSGPCRWVHLTNASPIGPGRWRPAFVWCANGRTVATWAGGAYQRGAA
jgi:hypothetical protein